MLLKDASKLYVGGSTVSKVYAGTNLVWQPTAFTFADNFNRSNGNLESAAASGGWSWSHDGAIAGALAVVGNQLRNTTTDLAGSAYLSPDVANLNQYVQFTALNIEEGTGPLICIRVADRNNFVGIRIGKSAQLGGEIELYRRVSGTFTLLYATTGSYEINTNDTVRLEASGTGVSGDAWRIYKNGTLIRSGTIGAAMTATRQGLVGRYTATNPWIDNYEAGAIRPLVIMNTAAAWIDATQASFADGAAITSYTSHSTSARVFTGSGTLNYRAAVDGKPRLHFNGGWLKHLNYTPPASGFTFVMVRRITGASPSSGLGMPMVYNEDAFNNFEVRFVDSGAYTLLLWEYSATGGGGVVTGAFNETVGTDYLQWAEWNTVSGGPVRLFINGHLYGSNTFSLTAKTTPTAALIIGTRGYAGDFPVIMQVGEALVFDGVLSDADRTEVTNYLMTKWNITPLGDEPTKLPAIPPFVNGAPPP